MARNADLFRRLAGLLIGAALVASAHAFNASGERWPAGQVTMHLQLGPSSGPLLDGATSWGAVAEDALAAWNRNLTNLRFQVVRDSTAPVSRDNGANNVLFSSSVYGDAWDSRTLGITLLTYDTRTRRYSEADVLFNATVKWDSYRGTLRTAPGGGNLNEFRRVAIHEFGHALGLNHPDDIGQSVVAVMNAVSSDTDTVAADDIAGARAIYDNPNTPPTSILSLQGSIGYNSVGRTATIQVGSIRNDGDAASGPIRLELWATPQPLTTTLPTGSRNLATYAFPAPIAQNSSLSSVNVSTTYTDPPNGSYYVYLLLTESSGATTGPFTIRDSIEFSSFLNVGPRTAPAVTTQPAAVSTAPGTAATFTVAASGTLPLTYQWNKDGVSLAGATLATLTISNVQAASAGNYSVVITNALGTVTSNPAALSLANAANPGRLINMSIRTNAGTGDNTLIVGAGLGGAGTTGSKAVLIRAVGPTLADFGVSGALADTAMTVFREDGTQFAQNDDWDAAAGANFPRLGAFAFRDGSRDSALYDGALARGSYSIQITGKNNATGVALAEIYDATPTGEYAATTPRLINVSARTQVGTGDNILFAGFVVGGTTPVRVLVRAVGPTLGAFGVSGILNDPQLEILRGTNSVAVNDNWLAADAPTFSTVGAFALTRDSRDAALVVSLAPGSYTAQVRGVGGTTGVALVEVYELP